MLYKEIIDKIKPELEKVFGFFEGELAKFQTGRASASLVEDIIVDCFGQNFPLKQLGTILSSNPRQLVIQPWDKSYLEPIEKAIFRSSAGISPVVDKDVVRINFPTLTEEFRKNLIRVLSEKQEETRKTVRHWREQAWKELQLKEREKEISEDDKFKGKDELQKLIDEYNKKIEEVADRKRKEIEG